MNIGPPEIIIVLLIVLLLFGSTRLPKLARSVGEASREFKKGMMEHKTEVGKEAATQHAIAKNTEVEAAPNPDDKVTMTQAELDALLAEHEAKARKAEDPPATS